MATDNNKSKLYNEFPVPHRFIGLVKKVNDYCTKKNKKKININYSDRAFAIALFQKSNRSRGLSEFPMTDYEFKNTFDILKDACKKSRVKFIAIGLFTYEKGYRGKSSIYKLLEVPPEGYLEDIIDGEKCLGCFNIWSPKCKVCPLKNKCKARLEQVKNNYSLQSTNKPIYYKITPADIQEIIHKIKNNPSLSKNEKDIIAERAYKGELIIAEKPLNSNVNKAGKPP